MSEPTIDFYRLCVEEMLNNTSSPIREELKAIFDSTLQKAINFDKLPSSEIKKYIIKNEFIGVLGRTCFYQHEIFNETEKAYLVKPKQWIAKKAVEETVFEPLNCNYMAAETREALKTCIKLLKQEGSDTKQQVLEKLEELVK